MNTDRELMQQALEALEFLYGWTPDTDPVVDAAITALREALAEQPAQTDWEAVAADQAMTIALLKAEQPAQQQEPEPDRVKFERHWRKTRGEKKANRELPRHPLQPQTYIQDSANRHWVTWQAAVRSVAPPAQRKPLTDEQICDLWSWSMTAEAERTANTQQHAFARAIERAHGIGEKPDAA